MRRTERNPDMVAEQSSDLRPRDQPASQPVQHSVCQWSVQTLLMCAMRSKAMITSMSSSGGSTVTAETPWQCKLEFNTDKMDDVDKVLTRDAGGTEQSQFQPSVRRPARIS